MSLELISEMSVNEAVSHTEVFNDNIHYVATGMDPGI